MRTLLLTLCLLAMGGVLIAGPISAPACADGTFADYVANGHTGCSAGLLTYKDFDFHVGYGAGETSISDPLSHLASAATINVTAPTGTFAELDFMSSDFQVFGSDRAVYYLHYVIDPPPPIIEGYRGRMASNSPVAPGLARVIVDLCADAPPAVTEEISVFEERPTCRPYHFELYDLGDIGEHLFDGVKIDPKTNFLDVRMEIILEANGASSVFEGVSTAPLPTPEPASYAMLGTGLAALALFRRRR
jgi:hypothetical protein